MNAQRHIRSFLAKSIVGNTKAFLQVIFLVVVTKALFMLAPILAGKIIDLVTENKVQSLSDYLAPLLLLGATLLLCLGFSPLKGHFLFSFIKSVTVTNSRGWFETVFKKDIESFEREKSGGLANAITRGVFCHIGMLDHFMGNVIPMAVELLLACAILFYLGTWPLFLCIGIMLIGHYFLTGFLIKRKKRHMDDAIKTEDALIGDCVEFLSNGKLVSIEKQYDYVVKKLTACISRYTGTIAKWFTSGAFIESLYLLSTGIALFIIIAFTPYLVAQKGVSIGNIVILISITSIAVGSVNSLLKTKDFITTQISEVQSFLDILGKESFYRKGVELKEVSQLSVSKFSFCDKGTRFKLDANLTFKKGEKIVITGSSGQGKTTLLEILGGLTKQSREVVSLNSTPLCDISSDCQFDIIRYCPQENHILSGPLSEGIFFQEKMHEMTREVLRKLGLDDTFVSGQKHLSKNGENISGGEARRLALARLFAKKGFVYLLDEPTASLDQDSRDKVWKEIFSLDGIIICATHDRDRLEQFDKIIHIKNGSISSITRHGLELSA